MIFGDLARFRLPFIAALIALAAALLPIQPVAAQGASQADAVAANVADESIPAAEAAEGSTVDAAAGSGAYEPLGPEWIKGQPTPGAIGFQEQHTDDGEFALWMHDAMLMPIITIISLFVLGLLIWVVARYNRKANAVPSRTSHNTLIEIVWTALPVLILVVIAVPSITLLARQYESPPEDALTIKATGYQWYWGYTYADNGGFEVISNMMDESEALGKGLPPQLAVDNRMVVPAGEPIRIQTFGADVIHSIGIPALWFKIDAVPGRINEPGIYYGQCMELCGARHGYMPIAIEALPRPQFEAWVLAQGGTLGDGDAGEEAVVPADQEPESSIEDAPGAGAPPTDETAPGVPVPEAA